MTKKSLTCFVFATAVLVLGACTLPWEREQPTPNFYVLSAVAETEQARSVPVSQEPISIGIIPGVIPKYLDRGGIVTRTSTNEIRVADLHRWGSPLLTQIETTVATNLRSQVPTDRVIVLPFRRALPIQYEIGFIIDRFERLPDGTVELDARWAIEGVGSDADQSLLDLGNVLLKETNVPEDYPAIIAAMSRLLGMFSGEIADAIRNLERAG